MRYLLINFLITTAIILIAGICFFLGGILDLVFAVIDIPGFFISVQILGPGDSMSLFESYPVLMFLVNYVFYFLLIALVQLFIRAFRNRVNKQ